MSVSQSGIVIGTFHFNMFFSSNLKHFIRLCYDLQLLKLTKFLKNLNKALELYLKLLNIFKPYKA